MCSNIPWERTGEPVVMPNECYHFYTDSIGRDTFEGLESGGKEGTKHPVQNGKPSARAFLLQENIDLGAQ